MSEEKLLKKKSLTRKSSAKSSSSSRESTKRKSSTKKSVDLERSHDHQDDEDCEDEYDHFVAKNKCMWKSMTVFASAGFVGLSIGTYVINRNAEGDCQGI